MSDNQKTPNTHVLTLARELLDDIELSRISAEALLLKATRLARLTGPDEVRSWLSFEMTGYYSDDPVSLKYMTLTGRWTDYENKLGYWGPLAQQEAQIAAQQVELQGIRLPSLSGNYMVLTTHNILERAKAITAEITRVSGVRSRVLSLLHRFVSSVYYEKVFSGLAEGIFEAFKQEVDGVIAERCGEVLEKLPAVEKRLRERDPEAVSQGLTTCRRILSVLADKIYPPTDATVNLGGTDLKLGAEYYQNRLNAYIAAHVNSDSRRKRLRQTLTNLWDRTSAGVHNEVSPREAEALLLGTYLFLGEVLTLEGVQP